MKDENSSEHDKSPIGSHYYGNNPIHATNSPPVSLFYCIPLRSSPHHGSFQNDRRLGAQNTNNGVDQRFRGSIQYGSVYDSQYDILDNYSTSGSFENNMSSNNDHSRFHNNEKTHLCEHSDPQFQGEYYDVSK